MKKLITIFTAVCLIFSLTAAATAEQTQTTQVNAITYVLSSAGTQTNTNATGITTITVQLPLHKMIEADIFNANTTDVFIKIITDVWKEVVSIPSKNMSLDAYLDMYTEEDDEAEVEEQNNSQESLNSNINITVYYPTVTYDIINNGETLVIIATGTLPQYLPAIKENFTYQQLLVKMTNDEIMLNLASMILDKKESVLQLLKEQSDAALLQVITGFDTVEHSVLKERIQAYINASNAYKQAKLELDSLVSYYKDVLKDMYNTKYTLSEDLYDDDDLKGFDKIKYYENKMRVIEMLMNKTGNNGTQNAAAQIKRNLERKMEKEIEMNANINCDQDQSAQEQETINNANSNASNNGKANANASNNGKANSSVNSKGNGNKK